MKYFIFDTTTGEINRVLICDEDALSSNIGVSEESVVASVAGNDTTHYIELGSPVTITEKIEFNITQDVDTLSGSPLGYVTFTGIPENTDVIFDGDDVTEYVDGSPRSIELTTDEIGQHTVIFTNIEYITESFIFTVE